MDLGATVAVLAPGTVAVWSVPCFLVRAAWRHAGSVRGWRTAVPGLLLWLSVVAAAPAALVYCRAAAVELPGCDSEYHRVPTEPQRLI